MYYFYVLQSRNKSNEIYTGSTNTLRLRLSEHNQGKVFSTKRHLPWRLIYDEASLSEKDARLREQKFKRYGKGNQELKKRLANSLTVFKKGGSKGLPLTFLGKKGEGFTLTELLFSVAVMAVLSTIVLADFHRGQYSNDLQASADIFVSNIRRMQNLAMAGSVVTVPLSPDPMVPPGGFAISIPSNPKTTYTLFADVRKKDGADCKEVIDGIYSRECDILVEGGNVSFQPNVQISGVQVQEDGSWSGSISESITFSFRSPNTTLLYYRNDIQGGTPSKIAIELINTRTGKYRTVILNSVSGSIMHIPGSFLDNSISVKIPK